MLRDDVLNQNMETTLGVLGGYMCEKCKKYFVIELVSKPVAHVRPMDELEVENFILDNNIRTAWGEE